MTHNLEATVFVYRNYKDKTIKAEYIEKARLLEDSPDWEHVATLEPRMWIECHYAEVEDFSQPEQELTNLERHERNVQQLFGTQQPKEQEQEPVAHREGFWCKDLTCKKCYSADFRFKHTTPPQREE